MLTQESHYHASYNTPDDNLNRDDRVLLRIGYPKKKQTKGQQDDSKAVCSLDWCCFQQKEFLLPIKTFLLPQYQTNEVKKKFCIVFLVSGKNFGNSSKTEN